MEQNPSDHTLVQRARGGFRVAFEALFERYYGPLFALLTTLDSDTDLVEEACQETFLQTYRGIYGLRDPGAFRPWLYRIARRRLTDLQRVRYRYRSIFSPLDQPAQPWSIQSQWLVDTDYVERDVVRSVLGRLRKQDRDVILLRHVAGLSACEIGPILQVSTGTAQRKVNRAEERFRRQYQETEIIGHGASNDGCVKPDVSSRS